MRWWRIFHIFCTVCLGIVCAQNIFRATRSLDDLASFTGQLSSVRVAYGISRSKYVIFCFCSPPVALGLYLGVSTQEAQQLATQVQEGDTLTIRYDAAGTLFHQEPNTLAYQVDIVGKRTIYSLAQMHHRYRLQAALYGLVMLVFVASTPVRGRK